MAEIREALRTGKPLLISDKGKRPAPLLQRAILGKKMAGSALRPSRKGRFAGLCAAALLTLSGCGGGEPEGVLNVVYEFSGAVVADEPQAAKLAQETLLRGGSAADAVIAGAFAMTATLPSRVGLMGGGVCMIYESATSTGEALIFRSERSELGGMVPGFARGMEALHARYGITRWTQLVAPAEGLARFGGRTSRAFARDAAQARALLSGDPTVASIFLGADGQPPREGEPVVQVALSTTLAQVRQRGQAALYKGDFPARLAAASRAAGQPVSEAEMRAFRAYYSAPLSVEFGRQSAFFVPPPAIGGVEGAQLAWLLQEERELIDEEGVDSLHLFAEAAQAVMAAREGWRAPDGGAKEPIGPQLDEDRMEALLAGFDPARHRPAPGGGLLAGGGSEPQAPGSASIVAMDFRGQAVACSFTLGRLFGSGRMDPETGLLYSVPESASAQTLSPAIIGNESNGGFYFAGVASGGEPALQALVRIMVETYGNEGGLRAAIEQPRIGHGGRPDRLWAERILEPGQRSALEQRGHSVSVVPQIGTVNAIYCPEGLEVPQLCEVEADRRGFGLPLRAD